MKSAIVQHEFFGALEFDEQRRTYDASLELRGGHKVSVTIDSMGIAPEEAFQRAQKIYQIVMRHENEYCRAIARKLLGLYNNSWRDGEATTIDGFMGRISLASITIAPLELGEMGCATLYYADGDLFAGHLIEVLLDSDFRFSNAQLAG
jgi:hypothetical protein